MQRLLSILALAALTGCATLQPSVPDDYKGPTATLADSGFAEDGSKAQLFAVQEIDGRTINSAIIESRKASHGRGFALSAQFVTRKVPTVPLKLKLIGTHQTAAPIHELASRAAGTFFEVEGVVEFTPVADARYVVKGELKKDGSSVWIEDAATQQVVTEKVRAKKS